MRRMAGALTGRIFMSGMFEERERGYEAKWAHDEEMHFAIMAERNRKLARWAAEKMKLPADNTGHYVEALIAIWLNGDGPDPVADKIRGDFQARNVVFSMAELHAKMKEFFEQAEKHIKAGQ